ncbi:MAG TPA: sugar phosphate isomerase/epimerase family protein [Pirellulales bacterium]|nr:sugar phosphate isomerase/epimerase family protein [Pirellulales bacterium]
MRSDALLLGYNTNGLAHHDPYEAVELLAEIGYRSVAITLDHGPLNPFHADFYRNVKQMGRLLDRLGMRSVIETGARYLLDPRLKHEPTLVSADAAGRQRRVEFLCRAVDAAVQLKSDCVSLWSGILREAIDEDAAFERLTDGLRQVVDYASEREMTIGFEPEPGMLIDTMDRFERLCRQLERPQLGLTLDIGHLHCLGETPIAAQIRKFAPQLVNVHIEDMQAGIHEHLTFGEGEIDFPPVLKALIEIGYAGGVHVELSRHSHMAPEAARKAFKFLTQQMA